ncbi:MAG: HsdR family type I site-specific deoxyribonuclease, partial [Pseudanabaena sp.]
KSRESIEDLGYKGGLAVTTLLEQVRELRKNQTSAEKVFWEIVRTKRFLGLKFRRQHQIGNYIVDFYCHDRKLVIELDGEIHNQPEQQQRDRQRSEYLKSLGLTVLRFTNQEISQNLETVLQNLLDLLSPSPTGRGARREGSLSPSPFGRGARGEGNLSLQEGNPRKGGVIWHTQGSGKSLSMVFLAGKLVLDPNLNNPTVVMLTDRNDLDDQLFDTFAGCQQLLRQDPQQASDRDRVRQLLNTNSGGIIFTTVQKFSPADGESLYPKISDRANIIVLADEAHRSQYGFTAKQVDIKDENGNIIGKATRYGFAKYIRDALPNACFVGFTGTPIEQSDKNTPAIFGDYIDIYDISQAVADGATVPIYYESRLVKVDLDETGRQLLDELDEDLDSLLPLGEGLGEREKAKANQTRIEAIVGSTQRLQQIAQDIVTHFEARQQFNKGKAMIVTMTRRIAVNLYDAIVKLRPDWHSDDLTTGKIKVVFTASASDEGNLVKHHTNKANRQTLAQRLKDPENSLELVIVCDMWLTGFDAPCLHTMYIDKPLKSHNLMQAIARINRVFHEKTGGLIVDYLGLAAELKKALSFYANSGGKGDLTLNQDVAVGLMLAKLEIVQQIMADFAYEHYFDSTTGEKLNILKNAANYVADPTIKDRFFSELNALSKAHSLAVPHPDAIAASEKISFFQAIQASLRKLTGEGEGGNLSNHDIETAIRQVVDQALVSDAVINIFDEAGIKNPDISIISDEFMAEVRGMEHQNLAVELLQKLLKDEIKASSRTNVVQSHKLADLLEDALRRYRNQVISVTDILEELLNMAKDTKAAQTRGEALKLEPYELAFYDALAQNQSAQDVMGVDKLRELAIVLCDRIRKNASIDWNLKESVRARMKVAVKRLLRQYGYPPDMEALATELVLEQAKVFTEFEISQS